MRKAISSSPFLRITLSFFSLATFFIFLIQGCASLSRNELQGTWIVTDAVIPGISALSTHEAAKWFGQAYQYNSKTAMLDQIACKDATYEQAEVTASQFLQQYKVPLTTLNKNEDSITVISVTCETGYPGPGQKVFMIDSKSAFIFWDGVFFRLEKTAPTNKN